MDSWPIHDRTWEPGLAPNSRARRSGWSQPHVSQFPEHQAGLSLSNGIDWAGQRSLATDRAFSMLPSNGPRMTGLLCRGRVALVISIAVQREHLLYCLQRHPLSRPTLAADPPACFWRVLPTIRASAP